MAIGVVTVISHITKQIYRPRVWPKVTLHNDQRDCCEPKTQVPVPWEVCTHVYPQTPVPQQVHPCPGPQAMWQFCMHLILGPGLRSLPACQTRNQGVPQLRLPPRGTKENGKTPAAFTPKQPTEESCSMDNVNLSQWSSLVVTSLCHLKTNDAAAHPADTPATTSTRKSLSLPKPGQRRLKVDCNLECSEISANSPEPSKM